jgi:hypothetical protein
MSTDSCRRVPAAMIAALLCRCHPTIQSRRSDATGQGAITVAGPFYERFADQAVALAQETTFIVTRHAAWAGTAPSQDRVPTGARIA